jgi:hypothetical protein
LEGSYVSTDRGDLRSCVKGKKRLLIGKLARGR